jgi:branched-chain amino acid transport system substrate-binding protein
MVRTAVTRVVTLALAASFASIPVAGSAADPFEINAILSVTGSASFLGKAQQTALGVLENQVNKSGGIGGRPVKFVIADDESNPQFGVQLMNAVIAKKAQVVLGSSIVAVCNAIAPIATAAPVVDYCFSPALHPPDGSYAFSTQPSTTDLFIASQVYFKSRGLRKIALITSSDATGQDAERGIDATYTPQSGMDIVVHEHFNINDVSVAAQMSHIKASGAQAMIAWSTGTPIATILRGAQDAGIELPIMVSNGNLTFAQMHAYASFMPKELLFTAMAPIAPDAIPNGPVKRKAMEYINAFMATGTRPDTGFLASWDPAVLVVEAFRKLGTGATATQIRDYINGQRGWVGIDGTYDFRAVPQRGLGPSNVIMVKWDPAKDNWVGVSKFGGEPLR